MFGKPPHPSQVGATFQSPGCLRCHLTATECRSRWITASIQNRAAIVILKEQTYVGWANVDHFKGMMKSPVLDCSERGPRERKRRWQGERNKKKKWEERKKKCFSNGWKKKTTERRTIFPSSLTLYFRSTRCHFFSVRLRLLCRPFWFFFLLLFFPLLNADQRRHMHVAAAAGSVTIDLIVQLCV